MGSRSGADVAELVDALDLGSSAERRGGSSPFIRTSLPPREEVLKNRTRCDKRRHKTDGMVRFASDDCGKKQEEQRLTESPGAERKYLLPGSERTWTFFLLCD